MCPTKLKYKVWIWNNLKALLIPKWETNALAGIPSALSNNVYLTELMASLQNHLHSIPVDMINDGPIWTIFFSTPSQWATA